MKGLMKRLTTFGAGVAVAIGLTALCSTSASATSIKVDLGPTAAAAEAGYDFVVVGHGAGDAEVYTGGDVDFNITSTNTLRSIDRGNPGDYTGTLGSLTNGWVGSQGSGSGNITTFILDGDDLDTATYTWTSYHMDEGDLDVSMNVTVSVDGGTTFSSVGTAEVWSTDFEGTAPATVDLFSFTTTFDVTAGDDVYVRFTQNVGGFTVINSFELAAAAVPEPSSFVMWTVLGIVGFGFCSRRRRRA